MEINDLRATLNRVLTAVNKQLRAHGRTMQVTDLKENDSLLEKQTGVILRTRAGSESDLQPGFKEILASRANGGSQSHFAALRGRESFDHENPGLCPPRSSKSA